MGANQPRLGNRGNVRCCCTPVTASSSTVKANDALTPLHRLTRQVHGFRLQLWREHLGGLEDVFREPETRDCVLRVRRLAEENWDAYVREQVLVLRYWFDYAPVADAVVMGCSIL